MPRDSTHFDPIDPPGGESDAELLLWQGLCPWCGVRTAFAPDEGIGDAWTCLYCNMRFEGPESDESGMVPVRVITAVWREGAAELRSDPPVTLPALSDITVGTTLAVSATPTLAGAVELGLELGEDVTFREFRPAITGAITMEVF